jgi:methionyl-tRNA synthetase
VPDETFLTESQLKLSTDGRRVSIESGHAVEWNDETNYCFKLSEFRDDIIYWLKQGYVKMGYKCLSLFQSFCSSSAIA